MPSSITDPLFLTVVIYRPRNGGNYHHWALDVHTLRTDDHCIFQTEGAQNHLYPVVYSFDTVSEELEVRRVGIGTLEECQWTDLFETIKSVEMQNFVSSWDCQEYVLDMIDALEHKGLLGSLGKYRAVKDALKQMRGDVDSAHGPVMTYNYQYLPYDVNDEQSDEEDEDGDEDVEEIDGGSHELSAGSTKAEYQYKSAETIVDSDAEGV